MSACTYVYTPFMMHLSFILPLTLCKVIQMILQTIIQTTFSLKVLKAYGRSKLMRFHNKETTLEVVKKLRKYKKLEYKRGDEPEER